MFIDIGFVRHRGLLRDYRSRTGGGQRESRRSGDPQIHRATVTGADLHYEGSVTIDADLLERADIWPNQEVEIWNVSNGERFRTYALRGQPGSGVVCVNGAAAHKVRAGDLVIIATFGWMTDAEARDWEPKLVFVDAQNRPVDRVGKERAGQADLRQVVWQ